MAAKAIEIQTRKNRRSSKRIRTANQFLANISLDGSVSSQNAKQEAVKIKKKPPTLDKEEQDMLSSQTLLNPSVSQRQKLLASFSTTDAIDEQESLDISVSASSTTASRLKNSLERAHNRATSFERDHKHLPSVECTSSRKLNKYQSQLLGKRILLCSAHCVPFVVFSTLKYSQQDIRTDLVDKTTYRLRRGSVDHGCDTYGIKGVDIGAENKYISYGHLVNSATGMSVASPRNIVSLRRNTAVTSSPGLQEHKGDITPSHGAYSASFDSYDPLLLDDPELRSGRHRKVLRLNSFMVSIIEYVKPSQLKKDLNEQFKEKFPSMEITLTKLRSLKRALVKLANECSLERSTVAYSSVYFEKLVLWGKVNKINRKLVAGSCLLLAAKFNNDLKKASVKQLIESMTDLLRVSTKDLFSFEIQALIALEFNLHLPSSQLLPHIKRLEYGSSSFI